MDAVRLSEMVGYQDDAIVSKEIIKTEKGSVTLFAFDQGQGLSEHTAPFDALAYVVEGEAQVRVDGKPQTVREGEIIVMPAGKPHSLSAAGPFKMLLVMIRA